LESQLKRKEEIANKQIRRERERKRKVEKMLRMQDKEETIGFGL